MMSARATRRVFLGELGRLGGSVAGLGLVAACAPSAPAAPPPPRTYRLGLLAAPTLREEAFLPAANSPGGPRARLYGRLAELGYVEGQNLTTEERSPGAASSDDLALELVRLPVEVLVVSGGPGPLPPALAATSIPVVLMGTVGDPVASGHVESLARPGRNVTGIMGAPPEVDLKRLQLLTEAVPGVSKVAVLGAVPRLREPPLERRRAVAGGRAHPLARSFPGWTRGGVRVRGCPTGRCAPHPGRRRSWPQRPAHRQLGRALWSARGLQNRTYVLAGGLMAYEVRVGEVERRAAEYVDLVLRGRRPADLPIERPTRYDLVLNLRAARALGLTLLPTFLAGWTR